MDDLDVRLLVELLRDRIIPDRTLGQHFLLDEAIIAKAVEIASKNHPINEQSHVLEIGPGPGSLTLELLRTGAKVTAIELDPESTNHLARVFNGTDGKLQVIHADALEIDWPEDITHIVANLPYQISSPVLEKIQKHHSNTQIKGISLLVQEEFAERMAMNKGHATRGPLGHSLWLDFDVELDAKVAPHSFSPSPRVHSRLTNLVPVNREITQSIDNRLYRMVITGCFANRRRKLRTSLKNPPKRLNRIPGWHRSRWQTTIKTISSETLELRPENLTSEEWVLLIRQISQS